MTESLRGKVAFITGGAKGIGKASALKLAAHGVRVALMSRTPEDVERAAEEVRSAGADALALPGDVSDETTIRDAIAEIVRTWDRLDIVFANAGVNGVWAPIEELTLDEWQSTLAINLTGTFLTVKYATPYLKKNGGFIPGIRPGKRTADYLDYVLTRITLPGSLYLAAVGVRVRRWVTLHGISINLDPDLSHFEGIVPCGIRGHGVTSLVDLGLPVTMMDFDVALKAAFAQVFGTVD